VLFDAMFDEGFAAMVLRSVQMRQRFKTGRGELVGIRTGAFRQVGFEDGARPILMRGEQTNTSVVYGDRMILKLYRKLEAGLNPDYEIGRMLTEEDFPHTPRVTGAIEYYRQREEPITVAIVHEFIHKEGDAWQYTLDALRDYFDRALASGIEVPELSSAAPSLMRLTEEEMPSLAVEMIGSFAESVRLLGQRTAQLHWALATAGDRAAFQPEPFTPYYQRALYQSMRNLTTNSFTLLAGVAKNNGDAPPEVATVLGLENEVLERFRNLTSRPLTSMRTRVHGDLHLGQVLYTGNDFLITDFEGEPSRPVSERRIKRSPLRDVAGMLRSFNYAVHSALLEERQSGLSEEREVVARSWGRFWQCWVSSIFLGSYLQEAGKEGFLSADKRELELLLDIYTLEKAVYELAYEINNRPSWLIVPLQGILEILQVDS
jgi:maltose alpha-D-glucosyltransferase/alpha-amylase